MTMEDIFHARIDSHTGENKGPVYPFDEETQSIATNVTGSWYLGSSLFVTEGSKLIVQGERRTSGASSKQKREKSSRREILFCRM